MKKLILLLAFCGACIAAPPTKAQDWGTSTPDNATCGSGNFGQQFIDYTADVTYTCGDDGDWHSGGGGGTGNAAAAVTTTCSGATATFTATSNTFNKFQCTLVATNVTSSTLAALTTGQAFTITWTQPVGGGITFAAITGLTGMGTISTASSQSCSQTFVADSSTTGHSAGAMVCPTSDSLSFTPGSGGSDVTFLPGTYTAGSNVRGIGFSIGDPAGSALSAASTTTAYVTVPFACTISAWNLLVDSGTITVKFWKVATGTAIPTSGNSINTSGVAISTGTAIHSTTVSDFTSTAVAANDVVAMNVTATSGPKFVSGVLQCNQ